MKTMDLNQNARTTFYDEDEDSSAMKALLDAACDRQKAPQTQNLQTHDEDSNISAASSATEPSDDSNLMEDDDDSMRIDSGKRKVTTPSPSTPAKAKIDLNTTNFKVLGRKMAFNPPAGPESISKFKRGTSLYSFARSWFLSELTRANLESLSLESASSPDTEAVLSPTSPVQITLQYDTGTDLLSEKKKLSTEELVTQMNTWANRARQEYVKTKLSINFYRQKERSRRKQEQYFQQETAKNMELLCNESDTL